MTSRGKGAAKETSLALIDATGTMPHAGWARCIDEVASPPPPRISGLEVSRSLLEQWRLGDTAYRHWEDRFDAVLCAWTAAIRHRHTERVQVLGVDDVADAAVRRGTIVVAPARDQQRVVGRLIPERAL